MEKLDDSIHIVGAGLAGSEAALQLANRGHSVKLYEMRGKTMTPAHKTDKFAELVCSNSFGSMDHASAPGHMKWEAEQLGSYILKAGKEAMVPAGQALGIDRERFSKSITEQIQANPNIEVVEKRIEHINDIPRPAIIATGPLTYDSLAKSMMEHFGDEFLYFFDAIAPIIDADSINTEIAWKQSRWDKGTADYYNCPLNKEQYFEFINAIKEARKIEPKEFEKDTPFFEACMPIEEMVRRGDLTPAFGPMKPKGLTNPNADERPFAVVQLRQENKEATSYNMVGFQTKMAYPEQKRVFKMIPGLEDAEFLKLGSIHRNLYINSTLKLNSDFSSKKDPNLYFAGQITGCEGYFDSTCVGMMVAMFLDQKLSEKSFNPPPRESALGSLANGINWEEKEMFQPTNINFGLFPALVSDRKKIPKKEKRELVIQRAKESFSNWYEQLDKA
ncbi:MAG: methylenetetrahydrofolate--tRNA-(uracil(54)-C(5))-methyltransferase (FADH(2)-oxidizing) TrmFO [Bdellovibrionales bacterium]